MRNSCSAKLKILFVVSLLLALAAEPAVSAQQQTTASKTNRKTATVRVRKNGIYFLSIQVKDTPLTEVAADLSSRLKVPVVLSPVMAKQRVTLDFKDLPLETALQMLAPLPYVHYELRGGSAPICREIFLNAYNEVAPLPKLENRNVSFVIQGDTEGDRNEDPLHVSYKNGLLSVSVKKQSLTAVLDRIASVMGVSFSMKQDSPDNVDLDFKEISLESAMSYFPPSVHVHVRKDLQRLSTLPLSVEYENKIDQ